MNKVKYSLLFIGIMFAKSSFAVTSDTLWTRTYGGANEDRGYAVRQTYDGGFIIAGYTSSFGAGTYDVYLIRTDSIGDTLWTKTYGYPNWDWALSIENVSDSGFIISGASYPEDTGGYCDAYILRTDENGDTLWTRAYGWDRDDYGVSIKPLSYGGYIIVGYAIKPFYSNREDIYLIRMDINGDTLWTKIYGKTNQEYGSSIQECPDSGFIVSGWTNSLGAGGFDAYLLRTDKNGDTLWTRTYGGDGDDWGRSVLLLKDSGFVVCGAAYSGSAGECDLYIIRTDKNGDTIWTKSYGGIGWEEGYSIQPVSDSGFIISGVMEVLNTNVFSVYVVRIDMNGDTLWTRAYGVMGDNEGYSIHSLSGGNDGFIISGITSYLGAGYRAVYLLKMGKETGVEERATGDWSTPDRTGILLGQNPFFQSKSIRYQIPVKSKVSLTVYDLSGRIIILLFEDEKESGIYETTLNTKGLKTGIYFLEMKACQIENGQGYRTTRKLILL